jgi:hypothetical protein
MALTSKPSSIFCQYGGVEELSDCPISIGDAAKVKKKKINFLRTKQFLSFRFYYKI